MNLLDSLRFTKGAVSRKDQLAALTHFGIKDGRITAYNGLIALSSPIALSLDCQPKAAPFIKAIEICESMEATPALSITKGGKLTVAAGKGFRVHIECVEENAHLIHEPEGDRVELESGLLAAFKILAPLVAEDASRPWARGILIREGSAYATNNVAIAQYWLGVNFPFDVNVPDECVKEIIRVKQDPIAVSATDRSITFHYSDDRWIKSQLLTTEWPDIGRVLDCPSNATPVPQDFFDILGRLAPYADATRKVHFRGNLLSTSLVEGEGATALCGGDGTMVAEYGTYNIDLLRTLDGLVAECDFTLYPKPALFFGNADNSGNTNFRGAIVGMKP